jgi:hypothetical protein
MEQKLSKEKMLKALARLDKKLNQKCQLLIGGGRTLAIRLISLRDLSY